MRYVPTYRVSYQITVMTNDRGSNDRRHSSFQIGPSYLFSAGIRNFRRGKERWKCFLFPNNLRKVNENFLNMAKIYRKCFKKQFGVYNTI